MTEALFFSAILAGSLALTSTHQETPPVNDTNVRSSIAPTAAAEVAAEVAAVAKTRGPSAAEYPKQVTVFRVGEQGCYFIRIPSIIRIGGANSSKLLALAQGRFTDGWPTNLTMEMVSKLSLDDGATWGSLQRNITGVCTTCNRSCGNGNCVGSGNDPASVWDEKRSQAVVFFDTRDVPPPNGHGSQMMVMTSADGVAWSTPRFAFSSWQDSGYNVGISGGPGLAAQIIAGPHAGRILVGAVSTFCPCLCTSLTLLT